MDLLLTHFYLNLRIKNFCFVEQYDFKTQKGHISVYEINDLEDKYIGTVLKDNFHFHIHIFLKTMKKFICVQKPQK